MIKISIIVPIFNREKYISSCLDSLINQSIKDIEIICINDGSTDNTSQILKQYQNKDSRIVIFEQENKGPSVSRNVGLRLAKGQFISFVDSDDFIEENTYELAYTKAKEENAEIVVFGINIYNSINGKKTMITPVDKVYRNDCIEPLFSCCWGMCNCIIERNLIVNNNIFFDEDISDGEDRLFVNMLFPYSKCVVSISKNFYNYRKDGQISLTNGSRDDISRIQMFLYVTKKTILHWEKFVTTRKYRLELFIRTLWLICDGTEGICGLSNPQKKFIATETVQILNNKFFKGVDINLLDEDSKHRLDFVKKYSNIEFF